ncbi:hypothetical protein ABZ408_41075 [Streptomyces tibetensis]|uniref:hypothetical protein n=1 Tax=Streptomyces tibetensis TaxID=2382123 RepID=UPI00340ABCB6
MLTVEYYQPRHEGGGRDDAEVLLNAPGRQLLAERCGAEEDALARTFPSWRQEDAKLPAMEDAVSAAAWRIGGTVAGPVAFGCRLWRRPAHGDGGAGGAVRAALAASASGTHGGSWKRTPTSVTGPGRRVAA